MYNSSVFEESYHRLNPAQKEAVDTIEGAVLVIAGPGSGKTQLLAVRVANILQQTDALPSSILCLTFTESAASNMRQRLVSMIGKEGHQVAIHTFHSFGSEIINLNQEHFFFGAGFSPADQLSQFQIMQEIFSKLPLNDPLSSYHQDHDFTFLKDALDAIGALKNGGITPSEFSSILTANQSFIEQAEPIFYNLFANKISSETITQLPSVIQQLQIIEDTFPTHLQEIYPSLKTKIVSELVQVVEEIGDIPEPKRKTTPLTAWKKKNIVPNSQKLPVLKDTMALEKHLSLSQIYHSYQAKLHEKGLYDFVDMLLEVVKKFEDTNNPELKYLYQEKYQYLLVDEFQDTNGVQLRLLENLLDNGDNNPNILAVGDDDQAIFKFQGANLQNIFRFKELYPKAKIVTLTQNYRSTQEILDYAMQVIENSTERLANLEGVEKKLKSEVKN